jgi:hypothetical protein
LFSSQAESPLVRSCLILIIPCSGKHSRWPSGKRQEVARRERWFGHVAAAWPGLTNKATTPE